MRVSDDADLVADDVRARPQIGERGEGVGHAVERGHGLPLVVALLPADGNNAAPREAVDVVGCVAPVVEDLDPRPMPARSAAAMRHDDGGEGTLAVGLAELAVAAD